MGTFDVVILGLGIFIVWYFINIYNRLVLYQTRVKNAFAQIEVQLKRRYDLIPNLVKPQKLISSMKRKPWKPSFRLVMRPCPDSKELA